MATGRRWFGGSFSQRSANMDDRHFSLLFGRDMEIGNWKRVRHAYDCADGAKPAAALES